MRSLHVVLYILAALSFFSPKLLQADVHLTSIRLGVNGVIQGDVLSVDPIVGWHPRLRMQSWSTGPSFTFVMQTLPVQYSNRVFSIRPQWALELGSRPGWIFEVAGGVNVLIVNPLFIAPCGTIVFHRAFDSKIFSGLSLGYTLIVDPDALAHQASLMLQLF